jgi:diguanylate cyclase (GGDEF)-like protein
MRIVLVDPSRAVQRAMTQLIEEGGHEVIAFADGLKAVECITSDGDVRALITSTQPHGMSGIELCAAARKLSGTRRALHVILMSSSDDYYLAVTALDNGADDFIHKPPNPDELRARLRLADRVTLMKQQLIQHATTDSLTGLLNRRAFFDCAEDMCDAAQDGKPLTAIMFDIDHFKRINDAYGHEMGDRVLATVGAQVKKSEGIASRLGGEEFGLLAHATINEALEQTSHMQQEIRALWFEHDGEKFSVTCSVGIAEWEAGDAIDRLLRRADLAMYEAKRAGRNRIMASNLFEHEEGNDVWWAAARAGGGRQ